jgi:Fe-S-cluster containining protein
MHRVSNHIVLSNVEEKWNGKIKVFTSITRWNGYTYRWFMIIVILNVITTYCDKCCCEKFGSISWININDIISSSKALRDGIYRNNIMLLISSVVSSYVSFMELELKLSRESTIMDFYRLNIWSTMSIFLDMDLSISTNGIIAIKYCMGDKFICHIILIKETLVPLNVLLLSLSLLDCLIYS